MTARNAAPSVGDVSHYYDEMDDFYREVWGEHVHHGLWRTGDETQPEAVRAMVDLAARGAGIQPGMRVVDVGSGYGATARVLAREYGAEVTSLTVSEAQQRYAQAADPDNPHTSYLLRDWLHSGLPEASFDAVVAIESLAHMDKEPAFAECFRVLRPGGRLAVCDWQAGERLRPWQRRLLLDPICREAVVPDLRPLAGYHRLATDAGFTVQETEDLTQQVRRTWTLSLRWFGARLLRDRRYRRFVLSRDYDNRPFAKAMLRIPVAYRTGVMRFGYLAAERPRNDQPG